MKRFLIRSCLCNANPCYVEIHIRAPKVVLITHFCRIFQKIRFVCGKAMNQIAKLHRKIDYFLYHARTQTWYSWTCTTSLEDNHFIRIKQSNDIILEKSFQQFEAFIASDYLTGDMMQEASRCCAKVSPMSSFSPSRVQRTLFPSLVILPMSNFPLLLQLPLRRSQYLITLQFWLSLPLDVEILLQWAVI